MLNTRVSLDRSRFPYAIYAALGVLIIATMACQSEPDRRVFGKSPIGEINALKVIRVTFNKPMVGQKQVGTALDEAPLSLHPALKVNARWVNRHTLEAHPLETPKPTTQYEVELADALQERLPDKDQRFAFIYQRLKATGLRDINTDFTPPKPNFALRFSHPVKPRDVSEHCFLRSAQGGNTIALNTRLHESSAEASTVIPLTPRTTLEQGKDYRLTCADIVPVAGNHPMARYRTTLHVYPKFALVAHTPGDELVYPDRAEIGLSFNTPVSLSSLEKHIRIKPTIPGFSQHFERHSDTEYSVELNLESEVEYRVTLSKKLEDEFGQTLGKTQHFSFKTGTAQASIQLEKGIYAIESSEQGYPVWSRNIDRLRVECAQVPARKVAALLTSSMNYDPWYSSNNKNTIDWHKLGLKPVTHHLDVKAKKNAWHLQWLKLNERCNKQPKATQQGLFLAQFSSPQVDELIDTGFGPARYPYRVLGNVTDLGVLVKVGAASGLVWVTRLSTGKPVANASVTLMTPKGRKVFQGQSDAQGILRIPGSATLLRRPGAEGNDEIDTYRSQRMFTLVTHGKDFSVVDGNWQNGIQLWNFGLPTDYSGGRKNLRALIRSDRGIYRPGETAHIKGFVREQTPGKSLHIPKQRKVKATIIDAEGNYIFNTSPKLSAFGGFDLDVKLDPSASLGNYRVEITIGKQTFHERFSVEAFRPVSFEITPRGLKPHYLQGDTLSLGFDARYLFGLPVKNAKVVWNLRREARPIHFKRFGHYSFRHREWSDFVDHNDSSDAHYGFVSEGESSTNANGQVTLQSYRSDAKEQSPQRYMATVKVTDRAGETISKKVSTLLHPTDRYLGLHTQEYVQAVDMPFAVNSIALTPDGKRIRSKATLAWVRQRWECTRTRNGYRSSRNCKRLRNEVWRKAINIPATGNGVTRITPKAPGEYLVELRGKDSRGKDLLSSAPVWVIGKGKAFWSGDESVRMSLISTKGQYQPGEQATLLPRANTEGSTLLVTTERNGILDAFVMQPQSASEGIKLPLPEHYAPNVFASVAMVKGRSGEGDAHRPQFKLGMIDLKVATKKQRLKVNIRTEKKDYEPGQQVRGTVQVSAAGNAVPAEVTLSVADEGVLQLIAYKTPDPLPVFYRQWSIGVENATNWNRIARIANPSDILDEEGMDGHSPSAPQIRSRFVSSAFWAPALLTNAQGEAAFAFQAPDNLSAFRLMAMVADQGHRFGAAEKRITIRKPLLLKAALPRFARQDDWLSLGATLYNNTSKAGSAKVSAEFKGLWSKGKEEQVTLKAGESKNVWFRVKAGSHPTAKVTLSSSMGTHGDAFVRELPLIQPLVTDRRTLFDGHSKGDSTHSESAQVTWPKDALAYRSTLSLITDTSGLANLGPGLHYLIRYPYGCLEQTLSKLLPMISIKELARALKLKELRGPKLQHMIRQGISKVLRHQHADGHFSLWPSSDSDPNLTAYALFGLHLAKQAKVRVPKRALDKAAYRLRQWATSTKRSLSSRNDAATLAMSAFVLATMGRPIPAIEERLFENRATLPVYGQALLLRALLSHSSLSKQDQADILWQEIESQLAITTLDARVKSTRERIPSLMSSTTRSSAIVLWALLDYDPKHPLVAKLSQGLLDQRGSNGVWDNTQDTLYSLMALAQQAKTKQQGVSAFRLLWQDKTWAQHNLKGNRILRLTRPLKRLTPREGTLTLTSSRGPLYYQAIQTIVRRDANPSELSQGFTLKRQLFNIRRGDESDKARVGEMMKVRLEVTTHREQNYVALVDPLAAGVEAINPKLATEAGDSLNTQRSYRWTHQEMHDDKVTVFANHLAIGTYVYEYFIRARIRGSFNVPPTTVEAMYEPEQRARIRATQMKVY